MFDAEKRIVRAYHAAVIATPHTAGSAYLTDNCHWRGVHPFGELQDGAAIHEVFWAPLHRTFTALHMRPDIFFAGLNEIDGHASIWVVSMGHFVGLFDQEWLGIPPTGRMTFLRYCTFSKVEDGKISAIVMHVDLPQLMLQAGLAPYPLEALGAHVVQPGPVGHDGRLFEPSPDVEGKQTLELINAMCRDLGTWQSGLPLEEELRRTWAEDMIWWGPTGIGATCTIPRYADQHSRPFRAAFSERSSTKHLARLAEGHFGGFFGWPNFTARRTGAYMGHPPSNSLGEFRVIDLYRREGDKLAENWIFIDFPHYWLSKGIKVLPAA